MKKTILTLVILLIMASVMSTSLIADGTEPPKVSGVYQVSILDHLLWISTNSSSWGADFIQTANIDATDTQNWNSGAGFSPIGGRYSPFHGTYDGDGHTIYGLYISSPANYCGLFGKNQGNIIDLGVINVNISAYEQVGGLVGSNYGSITKCYSTGSVNGWEFVGGLFGYNGGGGVVTESYSTCSVTGNWYVGGLIGYTWRSTVSNCYSTGSVNGGWYVGGLVGWNFLTPVSNCYSTGSVNGRPYAGGLFGYMHGGTVSNCYSTGSVSGNSLVGGLIGENYAGTVSNCYSTGSVNGDRYVGGLVAQISHGGTVSNSFWDMESSGQSNSAGGMGKTTAEMQTQSTFTSAGWDFTTIWKMIGINYPVFKGDCPPFSVDAGSDTTIYYGYGDENAILTATADGGNEQYSYLWSNNATTQTITVNPTTTTTYTVTVTDECDNSESDEVMVNVIDISCGKNNNKVLVCHNGHTICISPNAVPAHLAHGCTLDNCGDQLVTLPTEYELHTNYPNPFNPTTRIDYSLPFDSKVNIQIFDVLGREVVTLVNDNQKAGYYTVDFNASNLASGIYYYRMLAGDFSAIKKMVVIK